MKVEFKCGDTITIPEGCKATIKDGNVVFEEEQKFKDGDILINRDSGIIIIFKKYNDNKTDTLYSYYNNCNIHNDYWFAEYFDFATEEEKKFFFKELEEIGLQWNVGEKRVERIKNRVKFGHDYLFINSIGNVVKVPDYTDPNDDGRFNLGNYYLLEERAYAEKKRSRN